jgi:cyanophycinase-like exopeptidase
MDSGTGAGFARLDSAAVDHHHGQRNRRLGRLVRRVQSPGPEGLGLLTLLLDQFVADLAGKALKMPG